MLIDQLCRSCTVASWATQAEDEQAWLTARTLGIGGSDVGSICGVNPWSSALQVYFSKTGQFTAEPDDASKERMHWGHMLEPIVADEFQQRNPGMLCIEADCSLKSNEYPFLIANVDRFVTDGMGKIVGILECKTAGGIHADIWESGDIPLSYYYQVQHYMFVTGIPRGWICCLVGGNKFYQYDIFFDTDLYTNTILPKLVSFWNDNVLKLVEPKSQGADNELFAELFPVDTINEEPASFDVEFDILGQQYLEAKQQEKEAKKRVEELQAQIKRQLQEHARGYSPNYEFAWVPRIRTSVDSTLLKSMYPEIYEECSRTTSYRQMSVKKVVQDEEISF